MNAEARNGILATAVAAVLWGTSFPATKYALPFFGDALFFGAVRIAFAAVLALIILKLLNRLDWNLFRNPIVWVLGFTNAAGIALQNYGLLLTTASKTVLLVDINVVIVAVLSYWLLKERFGYHKAIAVVSGIVGVVLLTYNSDVTLQENQLPGDVLVFLSGCSYAAFIVAMKKLVDTVEPFDASVAAITTSAIFMAIPCAIMVPAGMMSPRIDIEGLAPMLYLGLVCTTMAYYSWAFGLRRLSATTSSIILLLEVVAGLVLSIALLGETLSSLAALGAAFVIAAIVLVSIGK
ncbi:MAG: DMT family transporter [Thermoplasmata archaeon]